MASPAANAAGSECGNARNPAVHGPLGRPFVNGTDRVGGAVPYATDCAVINNNFNGVRAWMGTRWDNATGFGDPVYWGPAGEIDQHVAAAAQSKDKGLRTTLTLSPSWPSGSRSFPTSSTDIATNMAEVGRRFYFRGRTVVDNFQFWNEVGWSGDTGNGFWWAGDRLNIDRVFGGQPLPFVERIFIPAHRGLKFGNPLARVIMASTWCNKSAGSGFDGPRIRIFGQLREALESTRLTPEEIRYSVPDGFDCHEYGASAQIMLADIGAFRKQMDAYAAAVRAFAALHADVPALAPLVGYAPSLMLSEWRCTSNYQNCFKGMTDPGGGLPSLVDEAYNYHFANLGENLELFKKSAKKLFATPALPADTFILRSAGDPAFCVDVYRQARRAGAPVKLWTCSAELALNQRFLFRPLDDGRSRIEVYAGTEPRFCLDLDSKRNVVLNVCYDMSRTQDWYYVNGVLKNGNGECLDVPSAGYADGTRLHTYKCKAGAANQRWIR